MGGLWYAGATLMDVPSSDSVIDAKILSLQAEYSDLTARIELSTERQKIITAQVEILREVRSYNGSAKPLNGHAPPAARRVGKLRPTPAILGLLRDHPEGLSDRQVVDELVDSVETASKNRRHLIGNILYQLRDAGRVEKLGSLNRLPKEPKEGGEE